MIYRNYYSNPWNKVLLNTDMGFNVKNTLNNYYFAGIKDSLEVFKQVYLEKLPTTSEKICLENNLGPITKNINLQKNNYKNRSKLKSYNKIF